MAQAVADDGTDTEGLSTKERAGLARSAVHMIDRRVAGFALWCDLEHTTTRLGNLPREEGTTWASRLLDQGGRTRPALFALRRRRHGRTGARRLRCGWGSGRAVGTGGAVRAGQQW